jgi:hypothetical protein
LPHHRSALVDRLRALLTQQRYDSVVVHNYCRGAEHFLEYLAQRDIAVNAATRITYPAISTTLSGSSVGVTVTQKWKDTPFDFLARFIPLRPARVPLCCGRAVFHTHTSIP